MFLYILLAVQRSEENIINVKSNMHVQSVWTNNELYHTTQINPRTQQTAVRTTAVCHQQHFLSHVVSFWDFHTQDISTLTSNVVLSCGITQSRPWHSDFSYYSIVPWTDQQKQTRICVIVWCRCILVAQLCNCIKQKRLLIMKNCENRIAWTVRESVVVFSTWGWITCFIISLCKQNHS